ncbi:MAG: endolytic transglycosylase MltG [Myxococcota bacterium]|nr:endolytic transglycosylase MltG [Myxococcota bacterium]
MTRKGGGKLRWLGACFLLIAGLGLVVCGLAWSHYQDFVATPASGLHEERIIEIPRGAGPSRVAGLLAEQGVVSDPRLFRWFLREQQAIPRLRAGEFRFWTDQSPSEVLEVLVAGAEVGYPVTLPPGLRIEEMAERVEAAGRGSAERYVALARDPSFIAQAKLGIEPVPTNLEGLLLPDTYSFGRRSASEDVLQAQLHAFKTFWTPRRVARAAELGLSRYEVVTLASIVEKETGAAEERPLIAGVFHNRLRKGMRLESDPTIIYGLKNYDGNIRRSDIRRPHPWNTYVIAALPPTPIAAPGKEAIDGVLWPTETDAIFFVSKGDGTHHFSPTYAEHRRMVDRYQRGIR